ncbi:hypothetical protein NI359_004244 [Salmonella enterica]|nr:hypothetical protein [Salmonella enterica]EJJ4080915.1 hypothetical protein [Salmonella enterica]
MGCPVSIVKELLENVIVIDAGATDIRIDMVKVGAAGEGQNESRKKEDKTGRV